MKSEHKIRIHAAEPPIEWNKIKSTEDFFVFLGQRDKFYGELVISEVINKKKKALLIMGNGHFNKCKPSKHIIDNPISIILKASDNNLVLINTITMNEFPFDQLPKMNEGDLIETTNPIVGNLKTGQPFLTDYPLKVQSDALLYFGNIEGLEFEVYSPFNDSLYEIELNRRKETTKMNKSH